jgi:hypothetical protein
MSESEEDATESLRQQDPPSVTRDMLITVLFIGFAAVFLALSGQFADVRISDPVPDAAFWPRAVLVALLVSGVLNLGLLYRKAKRNDEPLTASALELGGFEGFSEKQRQYLLAIALSIVFFFSLEFFGFFAASPFFLFVFAYAIGYRDPVKLTVFSVVVALVIFFAFRNVMNVALPYGQGPFRELSVWAANLF